MRTMAKLGRVIAVAGAFWMTGSASSIAMAANSAELEAMIAGKLIINATAPFDPNPWDHLYYGCSDYVSSYGSLGYDVFIGSMGMGTGTDCIPHVVINEGQYAHPYELVVPLADFVYWEFTGDVGSSYSCGGTRQQCGYGVSYYNVTGCDLDSTFHIWWYGTSWLDLLVDYEMDVHHGDSCD